MTVSLLMTPEKAMASGLQWPDLEAGGMWWMCDLSRELQMRWENAWGSQRRRKCTIAAVLYCGIREKPRGKERQSLPVFCVVIGQQIAAQ
jgi:hypothetical protein